MEIKRKDVFIEMICRGLIDGVGGVFRLRKVMRNFGEFEFC